MDEGTRRKRALRGDAEALATLGRQIMADGWARLAAEDAARALAHAGQEAERGMVEPRMP